MIGYVAVLAVGYVLGPRRAGVDMSRSPAHMRRHREPRGQGRIKAGRRKIADRVSPDPKMVTLTPIDAGTAVLEPETAPAEECARRWPG